jgi:SAM-dependent methyltransferase
MSIFWICPACKGTLSPEPETVVCTSCNRIYPLVAEMPDFRGEENAWIDFERDRDRAFRVDEIVRTEGLEAAILDVFLTSRGFSERKGRFRASQVRVGADKYGLQLDNWLADIQTEPIIEIGVGPGQLAVALARRGHVPHGIDVSMEWLTVAKHWVRAQGVEPVFAGALAESLPVADASVMSFVSLDVIEHVGDQGLYLSEMTRVLAPGGHFALVTPNRYSLAPEPHVGVWGVGYLPRSLQGKWVKFRANVSYDFNRLLSVWEVRLLFRDNGGLTPKIDFPPIAEAEIELFPQHKMFLARLYNRLARTSVFRALAPLGGAYYRVTGRKSGPEIATATEPVPIAK